MSRAHSRMRVTFSGANTAKSSVGMQSTYRLYCMRFSCGVARVVARAGGEEGQGAEGSGAEGAAGMIGR